MNEVAPKINIADVLLEEISLFLRESESLKAKIMDLPDSVRLTIMPVLLQGKNGCSCGNLSMANKIFQTNTH